MWKRILLVLVLATPVVAQVTGNLQHQINDLRSQLEEIRELLDSNNPIDLGARITEAFESGSNLASFTLWFVSIIGGLIVIIGTILGILGVKEIRQAKQIRDEAQTAKEKAEKFADKTEKCAIEAEGHLQKLEERTKRLDEVEPRIKSVEYKVTPAFLSGLIAKDDENYEEALKHFEREIVENPKNEEAWFQKGYCLDKLRRFEEAIEAYDDTVSLKPAYHEAYYNKGSALCELGRYDEAIKAYDEAIKLKPAFPEAHNNKGTTLFKLGLYDKAIAACNEAIRLKPDLYNAYNNKGSALCELGHYDEAIEAYDEALKHKPDNHGAHNNKAVSFFRWGATLTGEESKEKFDLAKKSAKKAIEYSKGKEGHYSLACVQVKLGELEDALVSLKKSKENEEKVTVDPWQDKDLADLRKGEWRDKFIEIFGPPPEGV